MIVDPVHLLFISIKSSVSKSMTAMDSYQSLYQRDGAYIMLMAVVGGVMSILILMLCARGKKEYVKNDELDGIAGDKTGSLSNGRTDYVKENEKRASQHSLPNEGRNLPNIPASNENSVNDGSSTPGPSRTRASSAESSHRNSRSSPKKSTTRRLPALPPGQIQQDADDKKDVEDMDAAYEDLRVENTVQLTPQTETVGSGDSSLYAKVPEDLSKRADDDLDLYAQVGGDEVTDSQPGTSSAVDERKVSTSSDDQTMDSPTAVTYASVDKMKKTMSVKKRNVGESSNPLPGAPPVVPDRNFDEDEILNPPDEEDSLPPPPPEILIQSDADLAPEIQAPAQAGPAYETLSVRESLAHQRLRQMVEDEQRNRYVNTSTGTDAVDLYSQISEDNPEALYESVSVPGSADGTVGVTGRPAAADNAAQRRREDGYTTIGSARGANQDSSMPSESAPDVNASNSNNVSDARASAVPDYETIEIR